ncbi:hypothetical protein [Laspinema palackyanum]
MASATSSTPISRSHLYGGGSSFFVTGGKRSYPVGNRASLRESTH